jgi:hypothetical protein
MDIILEFREVIMKRQPIIWGIILLLVMMSLYPIILGEESNSNSLKNEHSNRLYLIDYNTYIGIIYDLTPLNNPIPLGVSTTIPITITYWTNLQPPTLIHLLPYRIRNLFLFGSVFKPMQKIHIDVLDIPDWAEIYITSPDVLTDIPIDGDYYEIETNLVFIPSFDAPSKDTAINIRASCEDVGRFIGFDTTETIEFIPEFLPNLHISFPQVIQTTPWGPINIPVSVTNKGNHIARVTSYYGDFEDMNKWTPVVYPPNIEIDVDDTAIFMFGLVTPSDFGGFKNIYFKLLCEIYPYVSDSPSELYELSVIVYYIP